MNSTYIITNSSSLIHYLRYEVNAKTDLAAKFPTSPLENHHLEVSLEILSKPESDIFKNVDINRRDSIRQVQEYAHTVKGRESRRTYDSRIDKYFSSSASKRSFPWMTTLTKIKPALNFNGSDPGAGFNNAQM